jgi:hypothetical protein
MMVKTEISCVVPLRCPRCGNTGKDGAFSANTFLLIKEGGLPVLVADYSERLGPVPVTIDCHECDHKAPIDEFKNS